jgi:tRNA threonylcarbamoyl adenosine modification protein YjeE
MVNAADTQSPPEGRICREWELRGPEATRSLGRALGALAEPGWVILLQGEMGGGKTVLAAGLARGLGVGEEYNIVSPTFTLLNVYPGRLNFYHADLYRLPGGRAGELELLEEAADGVLAVEWPERAEGAWPGRSIHIELTVVGAETRKVRATGPPAVVDELWGGFAPEP